MSFAIVYAGAALAPNITVIGVGRLLGLILVFYICLPIYCVLIQNK